MTTKKPTKKATKPPAAPVDFVYVMRCVHADMSSSHGFVWPAEGPVECDDWRPEAECGHGLHGWLWGEGDLLASGSLWEDPAAKWLVVRVAKSDVVALDRKVKFPRGVVVFCGAREAAAAEICRLGAAGADFATATAGYAGTATAGDRGTATAGEGGIVAVAWWDGSRYRLARGLVGENGIEAGVPYRVVDGKLARRSA